MGAATSYFYAEDGFERGDGLYVAFSLRVFEVLCLWLAADFYCQFSWKLCRYVPPSEKKNPLHISVVREERRVSKIMIRLPLEILTKYCNIGVHSQSFHY